MRRGHTGIGGWRNENTRHFRPRGGGNPHFRPRDYPLVDTRFPPMARLHRPQFAPRPSHVLDQYAEQNRNKFRYENRRSYINRPCEKQSHKQIFPQHQHYKHNDFNTQNKPYKETNYHGTINQRARYQVNNHGDIDHRQSNNMVNHSYGQQSISPLIHHIEHKNPKYDNKNQNEMYQHHDEVSKLTIHEYPGHRPPSSDHYGGKPATSIDISNTFSRSVDDTVNIVRKRLLNRNESLQTIDSSNLDSHNNDSQEGNLLNSYDIQQEQPIKRRIQKQKLPNRANCDKIKNNIVHQLFKMDKEKIHKLMDNPNSSSKFEYAISSLITESQNSFNRHLRSIAEKSLCSSSTDFIQNDNNTIYEDTFLKQMQCLLDPQDTVFLEDIKPIVMAELSKVLQLDDFEQQYLENEKKADTHVNEEYFGSDQYHSSTSNNYMNISQENILEDKLLTEEGCQTPNARNITNEDCKDYHNIHIEDSIIPKSLFERRTRTKSCTYNEKRNSISENVRFSRHSLDQKLNDSIYENIDDPSTLFDPCFENVPEDEDDPFAELDNQYHVAVDHNLIATEDTSSPIQLQKDDVDKSPLVNTSNPNAETSNVINIKQEIDNQVLCTSNSPLKLSLDFINKNDIGEEVIKNPEITQNTLNIDEMLDKTYTGRAEEVPIHSDNNTSKDSMESPTTCDVPKSLKSSNPRKRPIDQQASHRKEKRKKIEVTSQASDKQNKNRKANVNELLSENNDPANIEINQHTKNNTNSKSKEMSKESKKTDKVYKPYSNKYVKRKYIKKNFKEKNSQKISHNPSTNNKNYTVTDTKNPAKVDPKNILTTIDMFTEKPKKINIHQAHRNTAVVPSASNTNITNEKDTVKKKPLSHIKTKRHAATQVYKKQLTKETQTIDTKNLCMKFCQTEKEKTCIKEIQTDPVHFARSHSYSTDAFERMKEIDLEIQVLLQEKFKLYSTLENKETNKNSLQTLGMTVLNVTPFDENVTACTEDTQTSGDAIVEDFTNIPVEELEQIAYESVLADNNENFGTEKRGRRKTILEQERKKSVSPKVTKKLNKRSKGPNISLIEQIITDDRPLEDIIVLDNFEKPLRKRGKSQKISHARRKFTKQIEHINFDELNIIEIKDCSVVLVREDLNKLLEQYSVQLCGYQELPCESVEYTNIIDEIEVEEKDSPVINDLQFDMLDVSEDIVIGDNCEIKSLQDKELEIVEVPINEEIILDNSQASEDIQPPQILTGDSECKMYDYSADENLRHDTITVTGNGDAVLAIECIENNFIAACLDGNVYYFSGDGQLINTLRGSNLAVTCLTIVKDKYETTVYTGSLDSRIRYYDLETGIEKGPECNVLSPIQTMDRAWDTVFVGTRTGFVLQFECKNNMLIPISTVKFSDQSILALRAMKEGPRKVLLVAARSEDVTIKDAQTGLLLRTLAGPKMTVYTLLYEDGKVFCGTSSHQIQVFDYTSGTHVGAHEGGKGAVCLRASGGLLFAGCYDGCVYVYREGEPQPMAQLRGPGLMLLSLAIVGSKIIAGYKDRSLYIWKIPLSILQEMIL